MMDLIYPPFGDQRAIGPLADACTAGGSTLLTTGIDPGFTTSSMARAAIQLARSIRTIRMQELFVYGNHHDPAWALPFGFGQPEGSPSPILDHRAPTRFWGGTVQMLAEMLDVELEGMEETIERVYADEAFDVAIGHMPKGSLVAIRFQVAGIVGGEPRLFVDHVTRMRADLAPHWPRPADGQGPIHRIDVDGDPSFVLDLELGRAPGADHNEDTLIASAGLVLNAIPAVVSAAPGMVTPLSLNLGVGRELLRVPHP